MSDATPRRRRRSNPPRPARRRISLPRPGRRTGLSVLAVTAAALVAAVAIGGAEAPSGVTSPLAQETAAPSTDEVVDTTAGSDGDTVEADLVADLRITEYEVFVTRDPFTPILPDTDGAAAPTPTDGDPVPATPTSGSETPVPGAPVPVPPASPGPGQGGESPTPAPTSSEQPTGSGCVDSGTVVCEGHTVSLVDVFQDDQGNGAVVQVDGELHEVRTGATFASNFRALSIEPPCVTLQYGDDAFTLCEGESVLK